MRAFIYLILSGLIVAFDQLSKWAVMELIFHGDLSPRQIEVTPFFNWVVVWNRGISFGMFNQQSAYGPYLLIGLALLISLIFLIWLFRTNSRMQSAGLALVIGGAIGNVIDRVQYGAVFDFLDFHVGGYHWPAFNLADSCIVVGVFILLIQALFFEKEVHAQKDNV